MQQIIAREIFGFGLFFKLLFSIKLSLKLRKTAETDLDRDSAGPGK